MNWAIRYASEQPTYYCLIGMPGTGKSTYAKQLNGVLVSSDDYLDKKASELGITYNDAFQRFKNDAFKHHDDTLRSAISSGQSIIHDRTNLSSGARSKYLKQIPSNYKKIAVVFTADRDDPDAWGKALSSRSGKAIPIDVLESMSKSFNHPRTSEGFDEIVHVKW